MKKRFLTFVLLLCSLAVSAQTLRVAILETVDKEGDIPYATKLMIRSNLSKAITNSEGYEAYDRTDMDAIMGEQNFQRTGMVSSDQIKRLGEMTGANYILVAEAVWVDKHNVFVTAKVLDVETARTALSDNMVMGIEAMSIQNGCQELAKRMFGATATPSPISTKATTTTTAPVVKEEPVTVQPVQQETVKETVKAPQPAGASIVRYSKSEQKMFGVPAYKYGEIGMNDKEMQIFLKNNCPAAYKRMMSGKRCKVAGWTMFGVGCALMVAGAPMVALSKQYTYEYDSWTDEYDWGYHTNYGLWDAGFSFMIMSGISIGASLIVIPVGYACYNNAYKIYNKRCATTMTLNLTSSQNGIGLALCF